MNEWIFFSFRLGVYVRNGEYLKPTGQCGGNRMVEYIRFGGYTR